MGKSTVMRLLISSAIGAAIAAGVLGASAQAHADVNSPTEFGCTGFLG